MLRRFQKQKHRFGVLALAGDWLAAYRQTDGSVLLHRSGDSAPEALLPYLTSIAGEPLSNCGIVTALAQQQVLCHRVSISERLTDKDRDALAYYQAQQYFANTADNLALDAVALGPSMNSSAKQDLLLIAAHKEQVQNTLDRYQTIGIKLAAVDIYACAIARFLRHQEAALPKAFREGPAVLLDIRPECISLYCFWRLAPIAFFDYTAVLQSFDDFLQVKLRETYGEAAVGVWVSSAHEEHVAACPTLRQVTHVALPEVVFSDGQIANPSIEHMVVYGCALPGEQSP